MRNKVLLQSVKKHLSWILMVWCHYIIVDCTGIWSMIRTLFDEGCVIQNDDITILKKHVWWVVLSANVQNGVKVSMILICSFMNDFTS